MIIFVHYLKIKIDFIMANSTFLKSSIAKKVAMALSGLFLISFLSLHFFINFTSIFSEEVFNTMSHFMGYNFVSIPAISGTKHNTAYSI